MSVSDLPTLNAVLNGLATILLITAFIFIKQRNIPAHRNTMIATVIVSALFLVSYLIYHAQVGSVRFQKTGAIRTLYLSILLTHTVLAAAVPPLALITLTRGLKNRIPAHRKIARWTLPIWLYVSVTGVIVYLMLYQM